MDPEKWGILLNVMESGSLSASAEKLGYTPSGISRVIAALEEEVGFPLLFRGRKGTEPTKECLTLLPRIRNLTASADYLREEASRIRGLECGTLTIGSSYVSYYSTLAEWVSLFCRLHPGITVDVRTGMSSELAQAVETGQCDLSMISRREGNFDWIPLTNDALVVALPPDHPDADRESYPIRRLNREAFIEITPGRETDNSRLLSAKKIKPRSIIGCADSIAALTMVEAGLGVTLINHIILARWQGNVRFLPLSPPQTVEIGIAMPPLQEASPAARSFLAFVKEALPQLHQEN